MSTPIGHLEDLTFRAAVVLGSVARVLAEDTRRTSILFRRYDIHTPLVSAHEHNEAARAAQVVGWLDAGEAVALVSDAGTPLLSDPGQRIVNAAIAAGHDVVPVPGASALLAALVGAGLPAEPFTFFGFVPRGGKERRELLEQLSSLGHTAILYESPARLPTLLADLVGVCGADRPVAVARELTKLHETFFRGTLSAAADHFVAGEIRGEIVVVLGGGVVEPATSDEAARLAASLLAGGDSPRDAAREVARRLRIPRNEAYSLVVSLAGDAAEQE